MMQDKNAVLLAHEIYKILNSIRKNPFEEQFESSEIIHTLGEIIRQKSTLRFILPAFHGKSVNQELIFSKYPDYGEYKGIQTLVELYQQIAKLYHPIEIILLQKGHFYADVGLGGDDKQVEEYQNLIKQMIKPFPFIKAYGSNEFFPNTDYVTQRELLLTNYCPNDDELYSIIANRPDYNLLYKNYIHFYDVNHIEEIKDEYKTKIELHEHYAKPRAELHLRKYLGCERLVKEHFNNSKYIKLSQLYKAPGTKDQIGINMLPGNHDFGTSSFHVVARHKDNSLHFKHKNEIALNGGYSVAIHNGFLYFEERL